MCKTSYKLVCQLWLWVLLLWDRFDRRVTVTVRMRTSQENRFASLASNTRDFARTHAHRYSVQLPHWSIRLCIVFHRCNFKPLFVVRSLAPPPTPNSYRTLACLLANAAHTYLYSHDYGRKTWIVCHCWPGDGFYSIRLPYVARNALQGSSITNLLLILARGSNLDATNDCI